MFLVLKHGGMYKLVFGPKAFVVISDPIVASHVLKENAFSYDKVPQSFVYVPLTSPIKRGVMMLVIQNSGSCMLHLVF